MTYNLGHNVIIAYRLEDKYGNGPYFYNGRSVILPEGYSGAYLDPNRFKDSAYGNSVYKYSMCEYVLYRTAQVYDTGEVLFRKEDIVSKSLVRR